MFPLLVIVSSPWSRLLSIVFRCLGSRSCASLFLGKEAKTLLLCLVFFVVWLSFRVCMVGMMLYWFEYRNLWLNLLSSWCEGLLQENSGETS